MAVKFIDRNRKNEVVGDEIILRCGCGCGFVTISALNGKHLVGDDNDIILLNISHFGGNIINKKNSMVQELTFVEPGAICAIRDLINCDINNGNGIVEDINGMMLMIDHSKDAHAGEMICLAGFYNEKSFKKYIKNPQKNTKYLAWNLVLEEKEMNKFSNLFNNLLQKEFYNEICKENRTRTYNEENENN